MKKTSFFEEEWESRRGQLFQDYNRNRILPQFFPITKKGEKVLDVASGDGLVSKFLLDQGYDITAIDISEEAIKQAKARGIKKSYIGNVEEELPFKKDTFDIVFWGDHIEHTIKPANVLSEIIRVLKKDGKLVISTPNMGFFLYRWYFLKKGQLPRTEGIFSEPWEWKHLRFFNYKILRNFLERYGCKITKVRGVNAPGIFDYLSRFSADTFASILIVEASAPQLYKDILRKGLWNKNTNYFNIQREDKKELESDPLVKRLRTQAEISEKILDCGCGNGAIIDYMWRKNANFTGVDISSLGIKIAKNRLRGKGVKFKVMDLENLKFKDNSFDLVFSTYVLEHLDNPEKVIKEMVRVTKKGGKIVYIAPNFGSPPKLFIK